MENTQTKKSILTKDQKRKGDKMNQEKEHFDRFSFENWMTTEQALKQLEKMNISFRLKERVETGGNTFILEGYVKDKVRD